MMTLKKRTAIRILSFACAAVLAVAGFAIRECVDKNYYIMLSRHAYSRNLEELSASLNNINTTVEKVLYSSSPSELGGFAAELWKESGIAKSSLSQLPCGEDELTIINRFLSQVGDYSLFLAKKMIVGDKITAEERENVRLLSQTATGIAGSVSNSLALYTDGYWTDELISARDKEYISSFGQSMSEIEDTLTDYPTLIYDGPYSDHILTSVPKMTESAPEVDRHSARNIAAEFLSVSAEALKNGDDVKGNMPCYSFVTEDSETDITVNGGYIAEYRKYRTVGNATVSYEQAVEKAKKYLAVYGGKFTETYYFADEGMCTVNFAVTESDRVYYTDLIKIGIALDNGELMMIEADGWLANHHEREIKTPSRTEAEARATLSESLKPERTRLTVIPTSGKNEKLCYEFLCKGISEHEVLVYVNAETLREEDMLIVLKTDGGTLVK